MATLSFYARGVNTSAGNASMNLLNTSQVPVTELVFSQATSPISLDYLQGGADPDTSLYINNVSYSFSVVFSGSLPNTSKFADVNGVDLRGEGLAIIDASNGVRYMFVTDPNISFLTMLAFPNGGTGIDAIVTTGPPLVLCFAKGTRIATPFGERRVESLQEGDLVLNTAMETVRLRWVAHRHLGADELSASPELAPIQIPAHHFGKGLPNRRLCVSPQHRIQLEGWQVELLFGARQILVPAKHLLGHGITQPAPAGAVDYYHLLFDQHEIVISNGLPSESYQPSETAINGLDAAVRDEFMALFATEAEMHILHRPDACL